MQDLCNMYTDGLSEFDHEARRRTESVQRILIVTELFLRISFQVSNHSSELFQL